MIGEPDVTLTDYGLAVEAAVLAGLLGRRPRPTEPARPWFVTLFALTAVAAAAGGTVHGFFPDPGRAGARWLWSATLLAIGGAAWATWAVGARLLWPGGRPARMVTALAGLAFAAYALVVLAGRRAFGLAAAHYLPAALFLLVAFAVRHRRAGAWAGIVGVLLTLAGGAIQAGRIAVHPVYFTHNALYHVAQAVALLFLFRAAGGEPPPGRDPSREPSPW